MGDTDQIWKNNAHSIKDQIFVIIKPKAAKSYGDSIRTHLVGKHFEILAEKVVSFDRDFVLNHGSLSLDVGSNQEFADALAYLTEDKIIVMIIQKKNGYEEIEEIIGHRDPKIALQREPDSIRAIYGQSIIQNAIDCSLNYDGYIENKNIFFDDEDDDLFASQEMENEQQQQEEECLLILKPHILKQHIKFIKEILIKNDFEILAERRANLSYDVSFQIFGDEADIHQSYYDSVCTEWSSGEITLFILSKMNAFEDLENVVGSDDPEIARSEAPSSIRAKFGQDRIRNCCWYSPNARQYNLKKKYF